MNRYYCEGKSHWVTYLAFNTNANIGRLYHANIIASITWVHRMIKKKLPNEIELYFKSTNRIDEQVIELTNGSDDLVGISAD